MPVQETSDLCDLARISVWSFANILGVSGKCVREDMAPAITSIAPRIEVSIESLQEWIAVNEPEVAPGLMILSELLAIMA